MSETMTYLLRVWLPDRPGALGQVASRLGGLGGDVTGLEIVERSGGRAIDELVVVLPADVPVDLVAREIRCEDDIEVEDLRPLESIAYDPQLDALEAAAILLGSESADELAQALADHVRRAVHSSWACVFGDDGSLAGCSGYAPNEQWLASFIAGSPSADVRSDLGLDTEWVPLPSAQATLVVGRDGAFRARERQRLAALARISDAWFRRLAELAAKRSREEHPSRG